VQIPDGRFVVEQAPAWSESSERGVCAEGAVGARAAGRFHLFRYEIRCWRDGVIPDVGEAVESPRRLSDDPDQRRRLLELVQQVPTPVWGRDELQTGEMWNSNSLISWLITRSDVDVDSIVPPPNGRAPGWHAGIVVDRRQLEASATAHRQRHGRQLTTATEKRKVLRSVGEIILAAPRFVTRGVQKAGFAFWLRAQLAESTASRSRKSGPKQRRRGNRAGDPSGSGAYKALCKSSTPWQITVKQPAATGSPSPTRRERRPQLP
jgi:hypothetical protein